MRGCTVYVSGIRIDRGGGEFMKVVMIYSSSLSFGSGEEARIKYSKQVSKDINKCVKENKGYKLLNVIEWSDPFVKIALIKESD